jgi:hypothetical protein
MRSISILKILLAIGAALIIAIYFLYRTSIFPFGIEALECFLSFILLIAIIFLITKFQAALNVSAGAISFGLYLGLLWVIEIIINNFIHPGLPLRDIIDDSTWGIVAVGILYLSVVDSWRANNIKAGIKSGFFSGLSSGVVACLAALLLICFGMSLIVTDPLNLKEWNDTQQRMYYPGMEVYFAYQTLAGAMLHLTLLGALMGLVLGIMGGIIGKLSTHLAPGPPKGGTI